MNEYLVLWAIDSEASSPRAAAWDARAAQIREGTTAVVFDVQDLATGVVTQVDLLAPGDDDRIIDRRITHTEYQHGGFYS